MADTVENAVSTPDVEQPWAELGLSADEYQRIREILGRRPTGGELAMYSVMWSEHCSYKSSKKYLRRFGDLPQQTPLGPLLAGIGDNAGVVDIGNGLAVTFKAESHNHPSYVEPHQGAATGVGGIVRDIMAMGARPVGVMNALAFGPLDAPDTARVLPGAVSGIADYGNCLGLPTIGGQTLFDPTYYGNPLVNALCVGVLRHEDLQFAKASGVGNLVVLFGAATGGDGIGGASILASESFAAGGESKRPSVQVGDPFMEKLLIECTLDLFNAGVVEALQDFGAAGISCATSELASAGDGGMHVELDRVPLRDPNLAPEEILMSESQERMAAVVCPDQLDRFMEICAHWGVAATVIGEVTDTGRLHIDWHGERIVDVDPRTVAHDGPVLDMPAARPWWIDELNGNDANALPRDNSGEGLAGALLALVGSAQLCDRSWITDQYDRFVRGNTVLAQPNDAGMIRVDEETDLGIALSLDANGRQTTLNPYLGAQLALCEAYRNVAVTGATPVAVTDCLNYGSPYDPDVMWQFDETILGLVDGCRELGVPVTGGNVSLHNRTGDESIRPTPLVGVLGVIDDVHRRIPSAFAHDGDAVVLLGTTKCEFGGSVYEDVIHAGHLGGMPPMPHLDAEKALAAVMVEASKRGLLSSAHDLSDGGLAQALVESCLQGGLGVSVSLPEGEPSVMLFSESPARAIVSLSGADYREFKELCQEHGVPVARIGEVIDHGEFEVNGLFSLPCEEIERAWRRPIPGAMGE
ncbi:phosphoribosylformylglycinamidine synthase subunit PurL [Cutibacterium modestum]|uniref:Phosphoribosylformylglycinamidine synthase subunit PurL n=3 Tax=Bacillati TaxID=1783272 RepID=A0AAD1NWU3_9ACTN|nr:phosphoribosylformylglycinamidine synthase subunit PurL [Cutibacterium modestum]AOH45948.1 phosphoribosylformylglycinamidine synthase II [Cutibacterium modestum]EFS73873.1 phosphoribosylformylglycinamidine synthase II [Cutibacterium modestum HL037PA2]EFS91427.1 phosphoribosylformylglycinamidine synthase II [Cutibacterium modestum HL044PA1]EFT15505.1 phosphoribosylformylglycinamidine synthase II [Cutibacterium modestum HL037PA3]REB73633.1 phosphoribosylformylglycinamidine synthase II [Cutiba